MNISTTGDAPKVVADRLCAVYDEETHEVLHFHRVVTLEGGEAPDDDAIHARALEHARTLDPALGRGTRSILVDPGDFQQGSAHRVDVGAQRLVARPVDREPRGPLGGLWAELCRLVD